MSPFFTGLRYFNLGFGFLCIVVAVTYGDWTTYLAGLGFLGVGYWVVPWMQRAWMNSDD